MKPDIVGKIEHGFVFFSVSFTHSLKTSLCVRLKQSLLKVVLVVPLGSGEFFWDS